MKDIVNDIYKKLDSTTFYRGFGIELKGEETNINCPFHDDKNPSCSINKSKGLFYCHGCGARGDMIEFYKLYHKVTFKQAIEGIIKDFNLKIRISKEQKVKDWYAKKLRLLDINFNHEKIKNYFEEKNITKPEFIIQKYGLKYCEANDCIAIPVGKRWKLKPLDDRPDRWDNDCEDKIEPQFLALGEFKGQKNLVLLEGFTNLWALDCIATDEYRNNFYTIISIHGVNSTHKLNTPSLNFGLFENVYLFFDNDEAGNKEANAIKEMLGDANIVRLPDGFVDLRDYLKEHSFDDFCKLLTGTKSFNKQIKEELEKLKKEKNKLPILLEDLKKLDVVDEEANSILLTLCMASHKLDKCTGGILKGLFGTGKTVLVETTGKLMPKDNLLFIGTFSNESLEYMDNLPHMIIIETEAHKANDPMYEKIERTFRQLISEAKVTKAVAIKDKNTGRFVTEIRTVNGPIVYITTTTQQHLNEENESRLLILHTDDSPDHIARVNAMLDRRAMGIRTSETEEELICEKWRRYIDELPAIKTRDILVPFANKLHLQVPGSGGTREREKLLKIVSLVAWFNRGIDFATTLPKVEQGSKDSNSQANRALQDFATLPSKETEGKKLLAKPEDYKHIYPHIKEYFDAKAGEVDQGSIRDFYRAKKIFGEKKFTVKRLRDTLNKQTRATYKLLEKWLAFGMAVRLDEKEKNAYLHQLDADWELEGARLITPEDLEKLIEGKPISEGQSGKVIESVENQTINDKNTLPYPEQSQGKVNDGVADYLHKYPSLLQQSKEEVERGRRAIKEGYEKVFGKEQREEDKSTYPTIQEDIVSENYTPLDGEVGAK